MILENEKKEISTINSFLFSSSINLRQFKFMWRVVLRTSAHQISFPSIFPDIEMMNTE